MFRPIHWVIFRSIQLYVRVQDNTVGMNKLKIRNEFSERVEI